MVAYVSIGEIEPWRSTPKPYKKSWVITKNKTWNSLIANLDNKKYREFILKRVERLYKRGYRNFFLDTMDSYHVTRKDKELFQKQQKALISLIHELRQKYPKAKLIINRGFEILKEIHQDINAVVAESLISAYDNSKKSYIPVPKSDREWILNHLREAQKYGLDAISIDYSEGNATQKREIAKKIKELGIIPYVTDGLLQQQGECDIERIKREILILFNQSLFKDKNPVYSDVHLLISMIVEYYGYIPILYDISTKELPKNIDDRYSSVIIWSNGKTKNDSKIYPWAKKLKSKGIKILFFNNFVFEPTAQKLKSFGLEKSKNKNSFLQIGKLEYLNHYKPYEIKASIDYQEELIAPKSAKEILRVSYKNGQKYTPIAITPWGGYALDNSFLLNVGEENLWTINPFKFIKEALRLKDIPIPDPTTEAGRRILFVHIDGDGFLERVRMNPNQLAPRTLIDEIYKKYKIPQTVSIIQGEIDSKGIAPKLSPVMQKLAKELYSIPWIEPASHSFSHPFFWGKLAKPKDNGKNKKIKGEGHYHLPIPNYHFSLQKEIVESINFALSFAPKYKRDKKILFWSGDCIPPKNVLEYAEKHGVLAMNGGDTTIKKSTPWLSHIAPFGLQRDEYWQVYTAQQNENVYTNEWRGPFWGFRHIIETFKLTENPRRLKAIDIYYHTYSGSRLASLKALKEVYNWAIKQKTSKLYASEYIKKVLGFYRTSLAKLSKDKYEIRNQGNLRTIRFDKRVKVDIKNSIGVAGFNYKADTTYITLDKRGIYTIKLSLFTSSPYLIDSNGWVERVEIKKNRYIFKLKANIALQANFSMPKGCKLIRDNIFKTKSQKNRVLILSKKREVSVVFKCKQ